MENLTYEYNHWNRKVVTFGYFVVTDCIWNGHIDHLKSSWWLESSQHFCPSFAAVKCRYTNTSQTIYTYMHGFVVICFVVLISMG